jgi:hypothetical protein
MPSFGETLCNALNTDNTHIKFQKEKQYQMKKVLAVITLALAFAASAFAQTPTTYAAPNGMKYVTVSQKPTVTDWVLIPGGPFTRSGVAPYNMYYSPTTITRDGGVVAVVTEAIPTDGTPIRYTVMGIDCTLNEFKYETYDTSTDTWSDLSELKDIPPNTAVSHLKPLICQ